MDVVFIGNSLTEQGQWQDMFPDLIVANRGIGGETTAGLLARLGPILKTQPEKVFLTIGYNDLYNQTPTEQVFETYTEIVQQLISAGVEVYVTETVECHKKNCVNTEIQNLNRMLESYCAENGIPFIALNQKLDSRIHSYDGVHLNGQGYKVWRDVLTPFVYAPLGNAKTFPESNDLGDL